ncbi:hybrid sensor histidine kinase/response regulator [Methylocystis iwaonis]|uniref:histidine kinase n=1 Tax=Methylocystis iwaonis TaxID=2885079 RepID=A0ABM8E5R0_9HYPH|nr:hybrid sensor histidine kinase/response regulator [Methylocystis iwaonis]BDV33289.1 hypothetical protein SS37A_08180 [Methylocystis iwaonis]
MTWRDSCGVGGDGKDFRILILTPHGRDAVLAQQTLSRTGLPSCVCAGVEQLRLEIAGGAGAVMVSEEALPRAHPGEWGSLFGAEPPWSSMPIVVLLGRGASSHNFPLLRALEIRPNVSFLERPVPRRTLISALRSALEARRLQYQIRDALDEQKAANRKKDEFIATLSHELRNPLAPIRSAVHVLRRLDDDEASKDKASRLLAMIERQTDHLVQLVDDLLEASRITTGKIALKRRPVSLAETIHRASEISEPLIASARHKLSISLDEEPLVVDGDPVRLTQIFANLLNNAAKYTPPGGRIQVTLERDGALAIVRVADDGIGIPQGMLSHIFGLFSQSDGTAGRMQGGLGIGLALVKSLVEMHGGSVVAYSGGADRGSEFVVSLPLAATQSDDCETFDGAAPMRLHRRVLVVDDEVDVAESLGLLLESLGAEVRVVFSGIEALSCVVEFKPDVAFLDIGMPAIDGYEAARRIRAMREGAGLCMIALSGWGRDEDRARAMAAGFDQHLTKPVSADALRKVITAACH